MNGEAMRTWILVVLFAACVLAAALAVYAAYSPSAGDTAAVASRTTVPAPVGSRPQGPSSSIPVPAPAAPIAEPPEQGDKEPVSPEAPLRGKAPAAVRPPAQVARAQVAPVQAAPRPAGGGKPEPLNPEARLALSFVGVDPLANEIWNEAINDPSLPAVERSDLIEDLNEDGFADPANVTVEELPLVISRLLLIEQLAPYAMDEVNADAFAEAYKDLMNMYTRLTGQ